MSGNPLTKEEDWKEAFRRAQGGDREIRNQIVSDNMGLIYMVLKRFGGRGYDMEELFQIGAIGLLKAVDRFDLTREFAFSTYAVPMIIGEIQRFLRDDGMIHISRQMKEHARKISVIREQLKKTVNHEPTLAELEEATGLTREEIITAMEVTAEVESIYRPIGTSGESGDGKTLTIADQLVDEHSSENKIINEITVRQMLEGLEEKERSLLTLRYMEGKTQTEVAKILDMNQVAVSRLERKILLQLRRKFDYNDYNMIHNYTR